MLRAPRSNHQLRCNTIRVGVIPSYFMGIYAIVRGLLRVVVDAVCYVAPARRIKRGLVARIWIQYLLMAWCTTQLLQMQVLRSFAGPLCVYQQEGLRDLTTQNPN